MKKKKHVETEKATVTKVVEKQTEDKEVIEKGISIKEDISLDSNKNNSESVVGMDGQTNKKGQFPYRDIFVILLALIILASNVMVLVSVDKLGKKISNTSTTNNTSNTSGISSTSSNTSGTEMTGQTTENSQSQSQSQEQPSSSEAPTSSNDEETSEGAGENTEEKVVYLTFDDGPSVCTKVILDILDDYGVKATFFIVKPSSNSYLPVLNEIVKRGHTLAIHSYTHEYEKIYKNLDSFVKDVTSIRNFVFEQTGYLPTIYRFPGGSSCRIGDLNRKDAIKYLYSEGMVHFDWNVSADDSVSSYITKDEVIENICKDVGKNKTSVVLMHDTASKVSTVAALPELIEKLMAEGYVFKRIDENTPPVQQIKVKVTLSEIDESDEVIIEGTTQANTQPTEDTSEDIMEE